MSDENNYSDDEEKPRSNDEYEQAVVKETDEKDHIDGSPELAKAETSNPTNGEKKKHKSRRKTHSPSRSKSRSVSPDRKRKKHKRRRAASSSKSASRSRSPAVTRRRRQRTRSRSASFDRNGGREGGWYGGGGGYHGPPESYGRNPRDMDTPPPSKCLGVFGLSLYTDDRALRKHFGKFGKLDDVQLIVDRKTHRSRGFAFIYFRSVEDATRAKEECTGDEIDGQRIRVDFSMTKRAHTPTPGIYMGRPTVGYPSRGYGSGGGGGYGPGYGYRRRSRSGSPRY